MEATFTKRMKRISLVALAMFLFGVQSVWAQVNGDFRSNGSGEWTTPTTWQKYNGGWNTTTEIPSSTSSVFIENGHAVTINTLTAACKDLNISTVTSPSTQASLEVGTTGTSNLTINGRLKGYTGSASNSTQVISATGTADLSTQNGSTLTVNGTGTAQIEFINSTEWNAASDNFDLIVAPDAGTPIVLNGNLGVKNLTVSSGTLLAGTNTIYLKGDGTTSEGNVSIAGEFISEASTVFSKPDGTTNAGTLSLTSTGKLAFTGATQEVKMAVMNLTDGIVYYQMSGVDQNILIEEGDGSELVYGNVILKNSNKKIPSGEIFKVTKTLTIESGSTLELNAATLQLTDNGTISVAGSINADPSATINIDGTSSGATSTVPLKFVASDELGTLILNRAGLEATLSSPIIITEDITLNIGLINTTSNTLTLKDQTVTVTGGSGSSYVNGPVARKIDSDPIIGNQPIIFPVGMNNSYRPITLDIVQASGSDINTYIANQVESPYGTTSNLPTGVTHVSYIRYFTVTKSGNASITSSKMTLAFGEDDGVDGDHTKLTIVGSNGMGWDNLGNSSSVNNGESGGYITSANNIASFGTFILANATTDPTKWNKLGNNTLPVDLISFDAALKNNQVQLNWATATEKNNAYFVVERSATGDYFEAINTVKGKGTTSFTTNYTTIDKQPLSGVSYYRLKQVDFDGTIAYSKIVSVVTKGASLAGVSIYPNPASEKLTVVLPSEAKNVQVTVSNLLGQTVISEKLNQVSGNTASLNVANLPAGTYQLQVTSNEGSSVVKFIKTTF